MRAVLSFFMGLGWLLVAASATPHHSFSAEFDVGRPVEITGTVTDIEWTNPHAWLFIKTENEENWAVELLGVNSLMRSGMTPSAVKPGITLTVKGFGSRDGTNTANASMVTETVSGKKLWASAREG